MNNRELDSAALESTTRAAAPAPNLGHSREASLTSDTTAMHHQRIESLTTKMMALGLRREEAEARARQATSPEMFATSATVEEDFGGVSAPRGMIQTETVSMSGATASFLPASDGADGATTECSNCGTRRTPLWRRDPEGRLLCNACGLYYRIHGCLRPTSFKVEVLKFDPGVASPEENGPDGDAQGAEAAGPSGPPAVDGADDATTECSNCGTKSTPLWRRDPEGNLLCNACGLYYKLHGGSGPVSFKLEVPKFDPGVVCSKEEGPGLDGDAQGAGAAAPSGPPASYGADGATTECSNCGTRSTPLWRRDPKGNLLCNACGLYYKLHGGLRPTASRSNGTAPL